MVTKMPKVKIVANAGTGDLEARVEALEREIAALKKLVAAAAKVDEQPFEHDWKATFGRFQDDPTYEEAARLGRAWRRRQPKC